MLILAIDDDPESLEKLRGILARLLPDAKLVNILQDKKSVRILDKREEIPDNCSTKPSEEPVHLLPLSPGSEDKLQVRCFGRFEVFWKGEPVRFERRQSRELLALLIDSKGATITLEEACSTLWEDETDLKRAKHRIRNLVGDLKKTLAGIGLQDLLICGRGYYSIRKELVDCDYYRFLEGDTHSAGTFYGRYMEQYSWAEVTTEELVHRLLF